MKKSLALISAHKGSDVEKEKLDRINELARRVKAGEELTPEEVEERRKLREEYIADFRRSFRGILDNTVIEYPDGTRKSLKKD